MNRVDFLKKTSFPLDANTLDFVQEMIRMISEISPVFGEKVIVAGCEMQNGYVTDGLVVINKELLRLEGNTPFETVYIEELKEGVICRDEEFKDLYIRRCVKFGTGDGKNNFRWSDFIRLDQYPVLMQKIAELQRNKSDKGHTHEIAEIPDLPVSIVPRGLIAMWSGSISAIPSGWALCDGRTVEGITTPNLSGRFIVGYQNGNSDYSSIGAKGGLERVTLTVNQMPQHLHSFKDYYFAEAGKDYQGEEDGAD